VALQPLPVTPAQAGGQVMGLCACRPSQVRLSRTRGAPGSGYRPSPVWPGV